MTGIVFAFETDQLSKGMYVWFDSPLELPDPLIIGSGLNRTTHNTEHRHAAFTALSPSPLVSHWLSREIDTLEPQPLRCLNH